MFHHLVEDMKVVVMMIEGMVALKMIVVVMMVDGEVVEMTGQGMIVVVTEGEMMMLVVDGVVMTKGISLQEGINLKGKLMRKDLKLSVQGVELLFSYCNSLVC